MTRWSCRPTTWPSTPPAPSRSSRQSHVSLTRERALTVTRRTEGWPAGLHIAALIARDGNGEGLTVSGDDRYVADYLYRESLVHLPESLARFLRCTAVLDQLCAPLCDAVLGESGAQERLRRLESSNMFLIPLDRRREWYRYHALFREFLLAELRRVEPDVVMKLHLRAADWYEAHGSPAMARRAPVEHDRAEPLRPAGDRAGPTDLPGRPDVDRAALALRTRRPPRSRTTPRSPCWPATSRCSPGRAPKRNGGRRSSTPRRSTWSQRTARRPSSRPEQCSEPSCAPPARSKC